MKRSSLYGTAAVLTVAALTACGTAVPPQPAAQAIQGVYAPSHRDAAKGDLLYVTGGCGGTCVFSYPKVKLVDSLSVSGVGLCSDKSGNVFVATASGSQAVVYEYAHGGTKPIRTFNLSGLLAQGCGVDPSTGNLAVTYLCSGCDYGPVAIFKKARGTPEVYDSNGVFLTYCGYDAKGNLFADGASGSYGFLLELPKGKKALMQIALDETIDLSGQVQWDGKYVSLEDLKAAVIYQFDVSGSRAKTAGKTKLKGVAMAGQSWIAGTSVIVPFAASGSSPNAIGIWKYPGGGSPEQVIKKGLDATLLSGATVSI